MCKITVVHQGNASTQGRGVVRNSEGVLCQRTRQKGGGTKDVPLPLMKDFRQYKTVPDDDDTLIIPLD